MDIHYSAGSGWTLPVILTLRTQVKMKKWEYLIVTAKTSSVFTVKIDFESLQQEISQLGEEGWELVSTSDRNQNGNTKDIALYFKRPQL